MDTYTIVVAGRPVFVCEDYCFAMVVWREWFNAAKNAASIAHNSVMCFFQDHYLLEEIDFTNTAIDNSV